jgi:O-antigen ligase
MISLFIAPQLWIEPFVGWRPDLFLYGIWILLVFLGGDSRKLRPVTAQDRFFLLMIVWIALSSAVNGFRPHSATVIAGYLKYFLLYKLVAATTGTVERMRTVTFLLVLFALVLAVEGIQHRHSLGGLGWAGQTLGWIDPDAARQGVPGRIRWINIFDGPGVFCVVFTMTVPFVIQYLSGPFRWSTKIIGAVVMVPITLAIYYTGSRGGFLATLAVVSIFAAIRWGISPVKIGLTVALGILLFMAAPAYLTTMNDQSHSATHRLDMWAEGLEMVQQNPVFGIGKGNFQGYTSMLIAHNSSVEIMGETGLVGLFFWAGLIYMSLKNVISYVQVEKNEVNKSYFMALGLSVTGYIISSMFVTLEYETFYFLLGLCAVPGRLMSKAVPFTKKDFASVSAICIGWVVFLKAFVIFYK